MENKEPSYEEFEKEVTKYFRDDWTTLSDKQVAEYIKGKEAQEVISNRYKDYLKRYRDGEISYNVFMVGGASSVGNCLVYMY